MSWTPQASACPQLGQDVPHRGGEAIGQRRHEAGAGRAVMRGGQALPGTVHLATRGPMPAPRPAGRETAHRSPVPFADDSDAPQVHPDGSSGSTDQRTEQTSDRHSSAE